jgi:hypothetical protein
MRKALLALLVLLATPGILSAQGTPLGPEFRVNSYITGQQYRPTVAAEAAGNFVVVWPSFGQDGSAFGIFAQRYDSGGGPLGPEFQVNTYTTSGQNLPAASFDAAGNLVVVWASFGQDGSGYGIFGQRYAATGAPLGGEFRVNTFTPEVQSKPVVASDPAGNFVVVWHGIKEDGSSLGVFGQRYAATGAPLGGEFRVNTYTTDAQGLPSVAADASGNFCVAWVDSTQDGSGSGVFAQRFGSTGSPLGAEFRVNTYTTDTDNWPSVASDSAGTFVITWYSRHDGSSFGIDAQRFASTGTPLGPEFRVNSYTGSAQWFSSVASDSAGNFVIVWESLDQDGDRGGVYGQRFDSAGVPLGPEFRVNSFTTDAQEEPVVASDAAGHFVVVWYSFNQEGSGPGIFAQRYSMILPVELQTFTVE